MLEPIMSVLDKQRIILASSSPRRQEILKNVGLKFSAIPSLFEENLNPDDFDDPADFVVATAVKKVDEVQQRLDGVGEKYDLIIGADTIVYKEKKVYGKPKTEEEAFRVLKSLSGTSHTVYSGVCLRSKEKSIEFSERTQVFFAHLSDDVLKGYVRTGDPLDKAGGYGIQMKGATLIEGIQGDYFNVVGLPLHRLCKHLLHIYSTAPESDNNPKTDLADI